MKRKIIIIFAIVALVSAAVLGSIYILKRFVPESPTALPKNNLSLVSRKEIQKKAIVLEIDANTAIKNGDWAKATDKLTEAKKLYAQAGDEQSVKRVELRLEPVKSGKPPKPNGISRIKQVDPIVDTLK